MSASEERQKVSDTPSPAELWNAAGRAVVDGDATTLERLLREHEAVFRAPAPVSSEFDGLRRDQSADSARSIIADHHDFESWEQCAAYAERLRDPRSPEAQFEAAVDAIVSGDVATLERLLRERPELVRARSPRTHRVTLLVYVGANGVEGFRQKTPPNAVQIAEMLLSAGAEVDAVGAMYRGTTTLGLVATSVHPERAGVQEALIDRLLAHGASLDRAVAPDYTDGRVVNACLANGRPEGAAILARRGAFLDLEGAAGVGRLDVVETFFDEDGRLRSTATPAQMKSGFNWACGYGWLPVVQFLLARGIDVAERHRGETGLHLAALGGHVAIVEHLLAREAPIDSEDETWRSTPLGWALYGWSEAAAAAKARYYDVVRVLVAAGSVVRTEWRDDEAIRADPRMVAVLTGASR
jgi:hypothetical protein